MKKSDPAFSSPQNPKTKLLGGHSRVYQTRNRLAHPRSEQRPKLTPPIGRNSRPGRPQTQISAESRKQNGNGGKSSQMTKTSYGKLGSSDFSWVSCSSWYLTR